MKSSVVATLILASAFIICTLLGVGAFKNRHDYNNTIQVTGLGRKDFTSDLIVWQGIYTRKAMNLDDAYNMLKTDQQLVRDYLSQNGVPDTSVLFSAVDINRDYDYKYDDRGQSTRIFTGYRLEQRVEIESKEVDKIEVIAREITELINQGLEFNSLPPQYYYTGLSDLKLEMIAAATNDARSRAEGIAENAGARLGDLQTAQMGVFQIIARNSNEDYSWGGTYNTTSKMKTATITMKLKFSVND